MNYLSVCSGIEAATVAWHPLGWTPFAFAEIEPFPCAVLAHHYPRVPNHGDMNGFKGWPDAAIDILVGGTPCQSFSVAGLRKGMADPRGNLALVYLAIADRYRPEWIIWENVPGVLSSNEGRDFGAFIGGLEQLGYHAGWRVLDAQYVRVDGFGRAVPQRRRRVFVVGHLGDWRRSAAVLFERESLQGHSPPRRQSGEGIAPTISARPTGGGGLGTDFDCDGGLIPELSHCLNAGGMGRQDYETETETVIAHALRADGFDASEDGTGRGTPLVPIAPSIAATLTRGAESAGKGGYAGRRQEDDVNLVAFAENSRAEIRLCGGGGKVAAQLNTGGGKPGQGQPCIAFDSKDMTLGADGATSTLTTNGDENHAGGRLAFATNWAVRRLTPLECERLQGFPDGYTAVPYRNKLAADGPRLQGARQFDGRERDALARATD